MDEVKPSLAAAAGSALLAPCGIDCLVCRAHQRVPNPCTGCRDDSQPKPKTRVKCAIKTCEKRLKGKLDFCFQCDEYPCAALIRLERRYRTKYATSVIENLRSIQAIGARNFLEREKQKWTCPRCSGLLCMHDPACPACGHAWRS